MCMCVKYKSRVIVYGIGTHKKMQKQKSPFALGALGGTLYIWLTVYISLATVTLADMHILSGVH